MNAASVRIECEEDGLHLVIDGDSPYPEYTAAILDYRIQDIDLDAFYENVRSTLGGYLREMHEARQAVAAGVTLSAFLCMPEDVDESGGYATDDPKHPRYHSIHADIHDWLERHPEEHAYLEVEAKREAAGE